MTTRVRKVDRCRVAAELSSDSDSSHKVEASGHEQLRQSPINCSCTEQSFDGLSDGSFVGFVKTAGFLQNQTIVESEEFHPHL